jgi:type IV pilus assembly protein PilP
MVKAGQHIGTNYGRVVNIAEGRIDLIEIVPNGHSGWLERPRTVSLDEE